MKKNIQSYTELKSNHSEISAIPYSELIRTQEWHDRRQSIIHRDAHKCTTCNKTPTMAHYDFKSGKTFHLWFGEEKKIFAKNEHGIIEEMEIPDIQSSVKPYSLHVHHKLYILDRLPWDYSDDDLITLCNWCHWEFHENNSVPVFKTINNRLEEVDVTPCSRCHGAGWFPEYTHVESGICFRCKGNRYEELI